MAKSQDSDGYMLVDGTSVGLGVLLERVKAPAAAPAAKATAKATPKATAAKAAPRAPAKVNVAPCRRLFVDCCGSISIFTA